MTKNDFMTLIPGVFVVVYDEDWEMPFGWDDPMCEMVDMKLPVAHTVSDEDNGYGIVIKHPETGKSYTFHYEYVDLIIPKKKMRFAFSTPKMEFSAHKFTLNNYKYEQINRITLNSLSNTSLQEDFDRFKKLVEDGSTVVITEKLYKQIKKECPRIIGVLIGNHLLRKTKSV